MSVITRPQAFTPSPSVDAALQAVEVALAARLQEKQPRIQAALGAALVLCQDINRDDMPQRATVIRSRAMAAESLAERLREDMAPSINSELGCALATTIALAADVQQGDIHQRPEIDQVRLSLWAGSLESHIKWITNLTSAQQAFAQQVTA